MQEWQLCAEVVLGAPGVVLYAVCREQDYPFRPLLTDIFHPDHFQPIYRISEHSVIARGQNVHWWFSLSSNQNVYYYYSLTYIPEVLSSIHNGVLQILKWDPGTFENYFIISIQYCLLFCDFKKISIAVPEPFSIVINK